MRELWKNWAGRLRGRNGRKSHKLALNMNLLQLEMEEDRNIPRNCISDPYLRVRIHPRA